MMHHWFCVLVSISIACIAVNAYKGCSGSINNAPIIDPQWKLVKTVSHGKKYFAGNDSYPLYMVHVWGTDFEMGRAQGELMASEIRQMSKEYMDHVVQLVEEFLKFLPPKIRQYILHFGIDAALDLTWEMTRLYTPQRFIDELNGLAEGSGESYVVLRRMNLIPELIKAQCTMFGAWGAASQNGSLFQLRALDFDKHAPIKKWPTIIVNHPSQPGSHQYANVAWPGFVGSLTGVSDSLIGISEKVWLNDADLDTRFGTPWTYVLRDMLQFAFDLDSALTILANANRTCSIHVGIGDSTSGQFRGVEYSYKELNIYDWTTQPEYDKHPRLTNVVYWDKHKQPSGDPCLGSLLSDFHGKINAEITIRQIAALHETGDLQTAVYDFAAKRMYVSNAAPTDDGTTGPLEAYKRPYFMIDLQKAFAEKPPQ